MQNRMLGGSDLSLSCLGLGTSTWGATTDKDDTGQGTARLVSVQVEYSLLERGIEREVVPAAVDQDLGSARPGALGRWVRTGKYRQGVVSGRTHLLVQ
jgi:aryl-alcohol dehydrogenase-like predicted oxidoreductase